MRSIWFHILMPIVFGLFGTYGGHANGLHPNPAAIVEVESGIRTEANAAWWGFNPEDSTDAIQAAIDSGAERVIIPDMGADWIVRPIFLRSNLELILEEGVVITAKKGEFRGRTDSLFTGQDVENVIIRGYGATLRMQKDDYMSEEYERATWRMGINLRGSKNVEILGMTIRDTGGDGIYLGKGTEKISNENIVIRDVVADNNLRQGMSVISAKNLLVENSVFKNTGGNAPSAGIDLEPNSPGEKMENIIIRNNIFENNVLGMHMYLRNMGPSDIATITWENNIVRGGQVGINLRWVDKDGPSGQIIVRDCIVEDSERYGIRIGNVTSDTLDVRIENCLLQNVATDVGHTIFGRKKAAPIVFELSGAGARRKLGNVSFDNVLVVDNVERPVIVGLSQRLDELESFHNISGVLEVSNPYGVWSDWDGDRENYTLKLRAVKTPQGRFEQMIEQFEQKKEAAGKHLFAWPDVIIHGFEQFMGNFVAEIVEPRIHLLNLAESSVEFVEIALDRTPVYKGSELPKIGDISIDPGTLEDGGHEFSVTVHVADGGKITSRANFWTVGTSNGNSGQMPLWNASFEFPVEGHAPPGWNASGAFFGSPQLSISDDYASDGQYSVQLTPADNRAFFIRSDRLPAEPGREYSASIDVYTAKSPSPHTVGHNPRPSFYIEFWPSEGSRFALHRAVRMSGLENEWETLEVSEIAPEGTAYVSLMVYANATYDGVSYWDNAELEVSDR